MAPRSTAPGSWIAATLGLTAWSLAVGCAGSPPPRTVGASPPQAGAVEASAEPTEEAAALRESLDAARTALAEAWDEVAAERLRGIGLERRVLELQAGLEAASARRAALESELGAAIDEVLRSKASLSGSSSRAVAASGIAEARAAAQAAATSGSAIQPDLERVGELLQRADAELAAANYPGAAYLAERASELLRQARLAGGGPVALPPEPDMVAPLVPAEPMTATQAANLRIGPGLDYARLVVLEVGESLRAVARAGEWIQVERSDGVRGWVHERLVAAAR
jgi:Bacterial SH3 domain